MDISAQYGLRSKRQLQTWLKQYNTHGEIKSRGSGGGSYMRKARPTTPEERLEIVQDCLANNKNYGAMAIKYNCSYQQVRNWMIRYEQMGSAGLEEQRVAGCERDGGREAAVHAEYARVIGLK